MKIAGRAWTIKRVRHLFRDKGYYGLCDYSTRTILIDSSQSKELQDVTLLHELLHALWGYRLDGVVGDRTEERIVEGLDSDLHDLLTQL
jgi:Zn-dependent peptidase ImmA (M78 family)